MQIKFIVPGNPVPKERPRSNGGNFYTPPATRKYEELVAAHARSVMGDEPPINGAIGIELKFYITPSKNKSRIDRPIKKPDLDNLSKSVYDAMNNIVFKDDSQIVDSYVRKFYDDIPRVEIEITEL